MMNKIIFENHIDDGLDQIEYIIEKKKDDSEEIKDDSSKKDDNDEEKLRKKRNKILKKIAITLSTAAIVLAIIDKMSVNKEINKKLVRDKRSEYNQSRDEISKLKQQTESYVEKVNFIQDKLKDPKFAKKFSYKDLYEMESEVGSIYQKINTSKNNCIKMRNIMTSDKKESDRLAISGSKRLREKYKESNAQNMKIYDKTSKSTKDLNKDIKNDLVNLTNRVKSSGTQPVKKSIIPPVISTIQKPSQTKVAQKSAQNKVVQKPNQVIIKSTVSSQKPTETKVIHKTSQEIKRPSTSTQKPVQNKVTQSSKKKYVSTQKTQVRRTSGGDIKRRQITKSKQQLVRHIKHR